MASPPACPLPPCCHNARLPVWVKGVLAVDDALALQAAGLAGIIVSNHGGRSLDDAPASLDQLAAIRATLAEINAAALLAAPFPERSRAC
ncbi:MAG: alpha-hydroxy-acid oxidizing protein [Thauera sp.]|jgi:isopentenyl diphosphate isomerase/L-lactate dehydrogenase-like FMN-dependent dehydrogenase|nr:alpha-hydroxy-acid oxidizing protein [Thauera sp.]